MQKFALFFTLESIVCLSVCFFTKSANDGGNFFLLFLFFLSQEKKRGSTVHSKKEVY